VANIFLDSWSKFAKSTNYKNAALLYANKIGYPVIVKLNSRSQGIGVEKVYSDKDLLLARLYLFRLEEEHSTS
jgi:biotin carboxylase